MNVLGLITALRKYNLLLKVEDDNLKLSGDAKALPPELLQELRNNKEAIIEFLKESRRSQVIETIPAIPRQDAYPLSNAQNRIWILSQFEGGSQAYNMVSSFYLKGTVNVEQLAKAFQLSIARHESLRTVFRMVDDEPAQVILEDLPFTIDQVFTGSQEDKDQRVNAEVQSLAKTSFDLKNGPLFRIRLLALSGSEYVLLFAMHHIISDGWSMGVFLQEVMGCYSSLARGEEINHRPLRIHYKDYAAWLAAKLAGEKGEKAKRFWIEKDLGSVSPLRLPYDFKRPAFSSFEGAQIKFGFPAGFYGKVEAFAANNKTTVFNVFRAVLSLCLHRLSRQERLIIGTPVAARTHPELNDQIGLYVNTLPLASTYAQDCTFAEYLSRISEDSIKSFAFQDYPLDRIIEDAEVSRDAARSPLFDVLMVVQNIAIADGSIDMYHQHGFTMSRIDEYRQTASGTRKQEASAKFDLTFSFSAEPDGSYALVIEYRTKLFLDTTIQSIYDIYIHLLEQAMASPDKPLGALQLVTEPVREKIFSVFNQPIEEVHERGLLELLQPSFREHAGRVALFCGDGRFTYGEVDRYSNAMAKAISDITGKNNVRIGLLLGRTEKVVFSFLGCLKAGCTYVPVDVNYPDERISYIFNDAQPAIIIVDEEGRKRLPAAYAGRIIDAGDLQPLDGFDAEPLDRRDETAYILYTSGSTGEPKGVEITHRNTVAFHKWADREFGPTPYKIVYATTSYCFDLSAFEIYLPLIQGRQVRLLASAVEIPGKLAQDTAVLINTVPSVVRMLIDQDIPWKNVAALNMAGEVVPSIFREQLDYITTEVRNLYGPTEDTTYSTFYRFRDDGYATVPIGKSVGYSQLYILDEQLNLLPPGVEGEICLSGASVAKGYLNKKELTAEKFLPNPFVEGQRIYRTGDIGKWLPDGNVAYIGRNDDQVKIRGFRIELGEVQYHMEKLEGIDQAVVVTKEIGDETVIVAYWIGSANFTQQQFEEYLVQRLPVYMVPSYFIELEEIPLNSNGKLDKKALQVPDSIQLAGREYVPPRNGTDEQIIAIWREILNRQQIGIRDNFFHLGGHSLKATKVLSRIQKVYGVQIDLQHLFLDPTIENLSNYVDTIRWTEEQSSLETVQDELIL